MMQVLIRHAKVIDPQSGFHNKIVDILIEDGTIKTIAPSIDAKKATVVEGKNLHVSAGWIDMFADYREPGYEHKETIQSGLLAAAKGGFTQVMLVPNTNPVVSTKSAVQYILQRAKNNAVTLHPLGTATQNAEGKDLAEMLDMQAHGAVAFTDGWKPIQNSGLMLKALEYVKAFNGTIIQIPVDEALAKGGLMNESTVSTQLGMPGIPALAETLQVHRDIELLRYTGSRLHITGVSTAAALDMIRAAKKEGLAVTCSVTPYHLALTDEAIRTYDSIYKVSPPLRSEADRQAMIAGLKDGTIDCIASHHRPQEWDAKVKEFEYAADGMNVQEMAFSIVWDAVRDSVPLERVIDALTVAPRKIFNLPVNGIAENGAAELTIFTTDDKHTVSADKIVSQSRNNAFIGKELTGGAVGIINNNHVHLNQ